MEKQEKLDKIIFYVVIVIGILMILLQNGGKKKRPSTVKGNYGLEIINSGNGKDLKDGSIIPIRSDLTIGRKDDNSIFNTMEAKCKNQFPFLFT